MKILYGVPGEGMGHATRAKVVLEHLIKDHEIRIVSSDRAYIFLKKVFPGQTHEIKGFHLAFKDGVVSKSRTSVLTLKNAPENIIVNFRKYRDLQDSFAPDLVISDFESFAYLYARYYKLPVISIDNMQIIDRGILDIKIPESEKVNYAIAKGIVRSKLPKCNTYLISAFFEARLRKKDSILVPPIIRKEILQAKRQRKNHILVYQSSYGKNSILNTLKQLPNELFYLYGFNKEEDHGNVKMKKFSEAAFIENFSSAKAVFANGGYSFISEALFLNKPICSVPIKNQFEQYVNGAYVQKMGYGKMLPDFDLDRIKSFLYDLPVFQKQVNTYMQKDNSRLFTVLDEVIAGITTHKK